MKELKIESTPRTPFLHFDPVTGRLEMKGRSTPDNALGFFKKPFDWLAEYKLFPNKETTLHIQLEYFNTSSSKCLFDIFKTLIELNGDKSNVSVVWYYNGEDDDMKETGDDYKSMINLPFTMVNIANE